MTVVPVDDEVCDIFGRESAAGSGSRAERSVISVF